MKLTMQLTKEQQKQITEATGKTFTELNIDLTASGELAVQELDSVSGGYYQWIKDSFDSPK
jgi:hypothetical protein